MRMRMKIGVIFLAILLSIPILRVSGYAHGSLSNKLLIDAAMSTGQIQVSILPQEEYQQALRALSILTAEGIKAEKDFAELKKWFGIKEDDKEDLIQKLVEKFFLRLPDNVVSRGTGWMWDSEKGLVVTVDHLVKEKAFYTIIFGNGTKAILEFAGSDDLTDVALFKIKERVGPLPFPIPRKTGCLQDPGEEVVSLGYPAPPETGIENVPPWSATYGKMIGPSLQMSAFVAMDQVDNQVIEGYSGGPTISTSCGGIIGMNVIGFPSLIVPIATIEETVSAILAHGRVIRGWLGIEMATVSEAITDGWFIENGYDPRNYPTEGVLIIKVKENSQASKAKLKTGDVIIAIGEEKVIDTIAVQRRFAAATPGISLNITIVRGEKEQVVSVTVEERRKDGEATEDEDQKGK